MNEHVNFLSEVANHCRFQGMYSVAAHYDAAIAALETVDAATRRDNADAHHGVGAPPPSDTYEPRDERVKMEISTVKIQQDTPKSRCTEHKIELEWDGWKPISTLAEAERRSVSGLKTP